VIALEVPLEGAAQEPRSGAQRFFRVCFREQVMRTRYFNSQRRSPFVVRTSADEDEAQIETWMIGSGSEPTGGSLRCHSVSPRGRGMT
jgi:murein endopeptidase